MVSNFPPPDDDEFLLSPFPSSISSPSSLGLFSLNSPSTPQTPHQRGRRKLALTNMLDDPDLTPPRQSLRVILPLPKKFSGPQNVDMLDSPQVGPRLVPPYLECSRSLGLFPPVTETPVSHKSRHGPRSVASSQSTASSWCSSPSASDSISTYQAPASKSYTKKDGKFSILQSLTIPSDPLRSSWCSSLQEDQHNG